MLLKHGNIILYYSTKVDNISILNRHIKDGKWLFNRGLNYIIFKNIANNQINTCKNIFLTPCKDVKYINMEIQCNNQIIKSMSFTHNFINDYTIIMNECNESGLLNYIKLERNNNYGKLMPLSDDGIVLGY